jgi:hypothetical protein
MTAVFSVVYIFRELIVRLIKNFEKFLYLISFLLSKNIAEFSILVIKQNEKQ